jgi:hypothetical protein
MVKTRLSSRARVQCGDGLRSSGAASPCWRGVGMMAALKSSPPSFEPAVPRPWHEETPEASASPLLSSMSRPRLAALRLAASGGGVLPPRAGEPPAGAGEGRLPATAGAAKRPFKLPIPASGGGPSTASVCVSPASSLASVWKRCTCPDTTCSTRPMNRPSSTAVSTAHCTTKANRVGSGGPERRVGGTCVSSGGVGCLMTGGMLWPRVPFAAVARSGSLPPSPRSR